MAQTDWKRASDRPIQNIVPLSLSLQTCHRLSVWSQTLSEKACWKRPFINSSFCHTQAAGPGQRRVDRAPEFWSSELPAFTSSSGCSNPISFWSISCPRPGALLEEAISTSQGVRARDSWANQTLNSLLDLSLGWQTAWVSSQEKNSSSD